MDIGLYNNVDASNAVEGNLLVLVGVNATHARHVLAAGVVLLVAFISLAAGVRTGSNVSYPRRERCPCRES